MDPADAHDLVDSRLPKHPESGSDGEEEEEGLETLGGGDSCPHTSPCGPSESGVPKRARDEVEMEPSKRLRGEGLGTPGVIGDVPRDADGTLPPGRREAGGRPSPIATAIAMRPPPMSSAEVMPPKTAART
jgi:hypothetical protein